MPCRLLWRGGCLDRIPSPSCSSRGHWQSRPDDVGSRPVPNTRLDCPDRERVRIQTGREQPSNSCYLDSSRRHSHLQPQSHGARAQSASLSIPLSRLRVVVRAWQQASHSSQAGAGALLLLFRCLARIFRTAHGVEIVGGQRRGGVPGRIAKRPEAVRPCSLKAAPEPSWCLQERDCRWTASRRERAAGRQAGSGWKASSGPGALFSGACAPQARRRCQKTGHNQRYCERRLHFELPRLRKGRSGTARICVRGAFASSQRIAHCRGVFIPRSRCLLPCCLIRLPRSFDGHGGALTRLVYETSSRVLSHQVDNPRAFPPPAASLPRNDRIPLVQH